MINAKRELFEQEGIVVCISSKETLKVARNKYSLYKAFKDDANVPSVPTYTLEDDLSRLNYPCVAKPRDGRSSEGLCYLNNENQLNEIKHISSCIFQEKIAGSVCTVDYVREPLSGASFCVPREELLRTKNGAGTTVRIFRDETLEKLVKYIGQKLNISSFVNMEFIKNSTGYYLIDINPRFSAGIAFSCQTGYDFVNAHLACFMNNALPKPISYSEGIAIKYFVEWVK